MTTAPSKPDAKASSIIWATSTRLPGVREGLGRRNGECASISATSARAGTEATSSSAPSFGAIPPASLGTIVIVPPSDRTSTRGLVMMRPPAKSRPLRLCFGRKLARLRNLAWLIVREAAGRDDRQQGETRHGQQADLQCPQPRLGVDAYRLIDLLRCRRRALHDREQPIVADEVDVVEIDLRLELGRDNRVI